MDINEIILVIATGGNALLAACVWRARPRKSSTYLFLVMVGLVIFWTIANYAIDESTTGAEALFWTKALFASALGYIYLFYVFARSFPSKSLLRAGDQHLFVSLAVACAIIATMGTNFVFSDAVLGSAGLKDLNFGPLYIPFSLFGLAVAAFSIGVLALTARRAGRTVVRDQAVVIIIGWVVFLGLVIVVAAVLPYFIPSLINGSKIAPLFSIIMVGSSAYAIVRHQFLDITPYIRRGLVYSLLLGTILGGYVGLLFLFLYIFRTDHDVLEFLAGLVIIIVGIFSAPHIEEYFKKLTDQFFFKKNYEYSVVLEELCYILNTTVRIPQLMGRSLRSLSLILKPERIEFLYHKNGKRYDLSGGFALPFEPLLPGSDGLRVPVCSEERTLGEFLLWPKRSGDQYTKEDRVLLRTFANQAVVALEKAELYEQLKLHSEQLEDTVKDRTRHLEDLRASQREFIDDISHALQTPLTVLSGTLDIVSKNLSPEHNRYARLASQSMDELSRLIRNLLALARLEAIPIHEESVPIDLSQLVEQQCEYVEIVCIPKGILLTSSVQEGISMLGNRAQIEEAITNILSNAVRYTTGCQMRNIHVALTCRDEMIEISVQDSGIGINAEHLPHIFERFYRAQDEQGSGIGLAITKRVVERHGGLIHAESLIGTGTTLHIGLPSRVTSD